MRERARCRARGGRLLDRYRGANRRRQHQRFNCQRCQNSCIKRAGRTPSALLFTMRHANSPLRLERQRLKTPRSAAPPIVVLSPHKGRDLVIYPAFLRYACCFLRVKDATSEELQRPQRHGFLHADTGSSPRIGCATVICLCEQARVTGLGTARAMDASRIARCASRAPWRRPPDRRSGRATPRPPNPAPGRTASRGLVPPPNPMAVEHTRNDSAVNCRTRTFVIPARRVARPRPRLRLAQCARSPRNPRA